VELKHLKNIAHMCDNNTFNACIQYLVPAYASKNLKTIFDNVDKNTIKYVLKFAYYLNFGNNIVNKFIEKYLNDRLFTEFFNDIAQILNLSNFKRALKLSIKITSKIFQKITKYGNRDTLQLLLQVYKPNNSDICK